MKKYSDFLRTLHDDSGPAGILGRGTHASVLRALVWHDSVGRRSEQALYLDFAVIWDEDHDERVIPVLERLLVMGLLSPVVFAGERKGSLFLLTSSPMPDKYVKDCTCHIDEITQSLGDYWNTEVTTFPSDSTGIINDSEEKIRLYLANLNMLWRLGCKPVE